MRIRQIKPSFWQDSRLAALPPAARLFYIGLWMVADDGGYFRWDAVEIANELYGYDGRKKRERDVEAFMKRLVDAERVTIYDCGHAFIPTLGGHQRLAGETKQVRTFEREHRFCEAIPADTRGGPQVPDTVRLGKERVRNGQVRNGQSSRARSQGGAPRETDEEGESEFSRRVPRPA